MGICLVRAAVEIKKRVEEGEYAMNEPTMETLARRLDRVEREMEGKRGR